MKPVQSPERRGLVREILLFAAAASGPLAVRAALLWNHPAAPRLADVPGILSDIAVSMLFAAALDVAARRSAAAAIAMTLVWGSIQYGNFEHVHELGAGLHLAFAHYALDPTFLLGSLLAPTRPALLAVVLGVSLACISLATRCQSTRPGWRWKLVTTIALVAIVAALPGSPEAAHWRQRHFIQAMLEASVAGWREPDGGRGHVRDFAPRAELDGEPVLSLPGRATNVVLLILEGLPATALQSLSAAAGSNGDLVMPHLDEVAGRGLVYENFVLHQKQTNRGLYALLCGDLPKLDRSLPKMTAYTKDPTRSCLPRVLNASSFETAYLQAAPLAFMYKDAFAELAGFDRIYGNKDFTEPIERTYWGVDDVSLMRRAAGVVEELSAARPPFFLTVLTVGTHHPFTVPRPFLKREQGRRLVTAVRYLDRAVGEFVEFMDRGGHLDDTLVILTTDESRGDESLSDARRDFTRNWGPLIILTPEGVRGSIDAPYGQFDVALSILDYLGLDASEAPFIGRSLFRDYASNRRVYFGNVYLSRVGAVDPAGFALQCDLRIENCLRYDAKLPHLFVPRAHGVAPQPGSIEELREVVRYSRGRATLQREFSFDLASEPVVRLAGEHLQMLMDGQNLVVPEGSRIDVHISLAIEGSAGDLHMTHELRERGEGNLVRLLIPSAGPGDAVEIRYAYATSQRLENLKFRLVARIRGGGEFTVRIERATVSVTAEASRPVESRLLAEPIVDVRSATRAAN